MTTSSNIARRTKSMLPRTKHRFGVLRRAMDRAFRTNSKEAFDLLTRRTLHMFKIDGLYDFFKAKSDKLKADMETLVEHHNALRELTIALTIALDDFEDCQPCSTHTSHCIRIRRALRAYERVALSPPP